MGKTLLRVALHLSLFPLPGSAQTVSYRLWPGPLSESSHEVIVDPAVPMRTEDGTRLLAYVARPEGVGPFPVVLLRTPYGRVRPDQARFWASRGYIFVAQDVRGRFGSGGVFHPMLHEARDGYQAVEWAARLPGSNGKVGMLGASYEGWTQWAAATLRPPHLAAIAPQVAPPDPARVGTPLPMVAVVWACSTGSRRAWDAGKVDLTRGLRVLPVARIPATLDCPPNDFWDDWVRHPPGDTYWARLAYEDAVPRVQVPVLSISGWFDGLGNGTTRNFVTLARGPNAPEQRLVLGPWGHDGSPQHLVEEVGESGLVDQDLLVLRWFDRFLKGRKNGVDREPPVDLFVMGADEWRREANWPPSDVRLSRYYLHSGARANASTGDGTLDTVPPAREPADTFTYDPADPTPYFETLDFNLHDRDYAAVHAARRDVLVYTTPALERDVEIVGPVSATLWAATDARDTDWHAMLLDVYPDGRALRVQDGIVRARYRTGLARPALLRPGLPVRYEIDLWHTARRFERGHRIRVAIASAAFPRFGRNLNTGGNNERDSTFRRARQEVLHDADHRSYFTLPVVPTSPRVGSGRRSREDHRR
jgi:putative CocE/NonD family hydrolase